MSILHEKYGITEVDFVSSELEIVPAFRARSMGLDNSMVAAYGQDDKVCVYTSLTALLDLEKPKTTAVCIISDKEEIESPDESKNNNQNIIVNGPAIFINKALNYSFIGEYKKYWYHGTH